MAKTRKPTAGKKRRRRTRKRVIGRMDRVDLPQFELEDLPCRVDTGAASSALHCHKVKLVEREGMEMISFHLLDPSHPDYEHQEFRTMDFKERTIKNSFGARESRFVIKTRIQLFGRKFKTEFTLSDRGKMTYPVLLGRRALYDRFIVDVTETDLSYKEKMEKHADRGSVEE
jgi:hypothetical protein